MAQHFLLSSKARTISSREVAQLSMKKRLICFANYVGEVKKPSFVLNVVYNIRLIGLVRVNNGGANIVIIHSVSHQALFLPIENCHSKPTFMRLSNG